jgi:hypothetical protein
MGDSGARRQTACALPARQSRPADIPLAPDRRRASRAPNRRRPPRPGRRHASPGPRHAPKWRGRPRARSACRDCAVRPRHVPARLPDADQSSASSQSRTRRSISASDSSGWRARSPARFKRTAARIISSAWRAFSSGVARRACSMSSRRRGSTSPSYTGSRSADYPVAATSTLPPVSRPLAPTSKCDSSQARSITSCSGTHASAPSAPATRRLSAGFGT